MNGLEKEEYLISKKNMKSKEIVILGILLSVIFSSCVMFKVRRPAWIFTSMVVRKHAKIKDLRELPANLRREELGLNYKYVAGSLIEGNVFRKNRVDSLIEDFYLRTGMFLEVMDLPVYIEPIWEKGDSIGIYFLYLPCEVGYRGLLRIRLKRADMIDIFDEADENKISKDFYLGSCEKYGGRLYAFSGTYYQLIRRDILIKDRDTLRRVDYFKSYSEIDRFICKHIRSKLKQKYIKLKLSLIFAGRVEFFYRPHHNVF